jgi:O-antigen/teichoic acid export membrane protein
VITEPTLHPRRGADCASPISNVRSHPAFISSCAIVFASQAGVTLLTIASEICYARLLGPTGRGLLSLSLIVVSLVGLVGSLGGEIPIMLWTANRTRKRGDFLPAIVLLGAIGSLAAATLWATVFWRFHPDFLAGITSQLAILILVTIPANIFLSYVVSGLLGAERFGQYANLLIAQKVLILGGILFLVLGRWVSAETALFTNLLATVLVLTVALVLWGRHIPAEWNLAASRPRLRESLSLGARGQIGNVASFMNYRLDVFFVNSFLGPAQVGLYSVGVLIAESLWRIPYAVALALLPRTARTSRENNAPFTCLVIRRVLTFAFVGGIVLAIACPWILRWVFGVTFLGSLSVVWWILPGTVAFAVGKVMAADLAAREKVGYNSISAILALALTVVLDILLIPRMGIDGAALASSVAYLVNTLLLAVKLKKTLGVTWRALVVPGYTDFSFRWQAGLVADNP